MYRMYVCIYLLVSAPYHIYVSGLYLFYPKNILLYIFLTPDIIIMNGLAPHRLTRITHHSLLPPSLPLDDDDFLECSIGASRMQVLYARRTSVQIRNNYIP